MGTQILHLKQLDNFTLDRLHTNGDKVLYPTFVNLGDKETLNGDMDLFVITFKAKRNLSFNLKATEGILVDKRLEEKSF